MAGEYSFTMKQAETYSQSFVWSIDGTPVNVASYTAKMQLRKTAYHTTAAATFSTDDGSILMNSSGTITLKKTATESLAIPAGIYVYDLELTAPDGTVKCLLEGEFEVIAAVTR